MLLYFLLGIAFIYIFIPIIDNLLSIFSTWTEYINYKMVAKVYQIKKKYNIEIENEEESESESNPIGFVCTEAIGIPNEEPELPEADEEQEED